MKKQSPVLFTSISKTNLLNFTQEVKETIAFDLVTPNHKIFTAADLWSIQRQSKARIQRRYL